METKGHFRGDLKCRGDLKRHSHGDKGTLLWRHKVPWRLKETLPWRQRDTAVEINTYCSSFIAKLNAIII